VLVTDHKPLTMHFGSTSGGTTYGCRQTSTMGTNSLCLSVILMQMQMGYPGYPSLLTSPTPYRMSQAFSTWIRWKAYLSLPAGSDKPVVQIQSSIKFWGTPYMVGLERWTQLYVHIWGGKMKLQRRRDVYCGECGWCSKEALTEINCWMSYTMITLVCPGWNLLPEVTCGSPA